MENIALLGATGSVGSSVLDVIRHYPGRFCLKAVSGYSNLEKLSAIINEFSPTYVCIPEENQSFIDAHPGIYILTGEQGLMEMASLPDVDTAALAISGIAGLKPTLSAISADKKVLTANKESIVAAGAIINRELVKHNNHFISLDSEHNSIFNQLVRMKSRHVESITLTASGGPFREKEITPDISIEDVLQHPTWDMGQYITVNSANMMNKGFEVIEAHYLFGMPYDKINVLVHPQSIVHGMVTAIDGSEYLAASPSDMRYPIASAMFYPDVPERKFEPLRLNGQTLSFFEPDMDKFPLLALAYACGMEGGLLPAALNAANEIVVEKFLEGFVEFYRIPDFIARVIEDFDNKSNPELEEILIADKTARIRMLELVTGSL